MVEVHEAGARFATELGQAGDALLDAQPLSVGYVGSGAGPDALGDASSGQDRRETGLAAQAGEGVARLQLECRVRNPDKTLHPFQAVERLLLFAEPGVEPGQVVAHVVSAPVQKIVADAQFARLRPAQPGEFGFEHVDTLAQVCRPDILACQDLDLLSHLLDAARFVVAGRRRGRGKGKVGEKQRNEEAKRGSAQHRVFFGDEERVSITKRHARKCALYCRSG